MYRLFLSMIFLLVISCGMASTLCVPNEIGDKRIKNLRKAEQAYESYSYFTAAKYYERYYGDEKDKEIKAEIAMRIGNCYMQMNAYTDAGNWYEKAIRYGYIEEDVYLKMAESLKCQAKYADAVVYYKYHLREYPSDGYLIKNIAYCDSALVWMNKEGEYHISTMKDLNTRYNDFSAIELKNKDIILTTDRPHDQDRVYGWTGLAHTEMLYFEYNKKKDGYNKGVPLEVLNTPLNDGVVSYCKKTNELYFTQCNGKDGELTNCRILVSKRRGKVWTEPEELPFCVDSNVNYGQPAISEDGKMLVFSSNMKDGKGPMAEDGKSRETTDLYMSKKVGRSKTWGDPVNLGNQINTAGDEQFPYLFDENTLYFSSDGLPGMGGLDVFRSRKIDFKWQSPENLLYPINSWGDDFGFWMDPGSSIYNGFRGYVSSNRDPRRRDDIYVFNKAPIEFNLVGTVYNKKTGLPVPDAEVYIELASSDTLIKIVADHAGHYEYPGLERETEYEVSSLKQEFFESEHKFLTTAGLKESKNFIRDLEIAPFPTSDTVFEVEGILYGLDSANINKASAKILDQLAEDLKRNPGIVLELSSHTDCRATFEHNMALSERRADSCVAYLVKKGINPARLVPKGYGETMLKTNCPCEGGSGKGLECTEEEHLMNRRTEIRVLRTDFKP